MKSSEICSSSWVSPSGSHQRLTQEGAAVPCWGARERLCSLLPVSCINNNGSVQRSRASPRVEENTVRHSSAAFLLPAPANTALGTAHRLTGHRRCTGWTETVAKAAAFRGTPQRWQQYWLPLWCTRPAHHWIQCREKSIWFVKNVPWFCFCLFSCLKRAFLLLRQLLVLSGYCCFFICLWVFEQWKGQRAGRETQPNGEDCWYALLPVALFTGLRIWHYSQRKT